MPRYWTRRFHTTLGILMLLVALKAGGVGVIILSIYHLFLGLVTPSRESLQLGFPKAPTWMLSFCEAFYPPTKKMLVESAESENA